MRQRDNYYSVVEASEVLGRSIPTIYKWMHSGKLTAIKNPVDGRYMILKSEVDEKTEWA